MSMLIAVMPGYKIVLADSPRRAGKLMNSNGLTNGLSPREWQTASMYSVCWASVKPAMFPATTSRITSGATAIMPPW